MISSFSRFITKEIDDFNNARHHLFSFTSEFCVDMILQTAGYVMVQFSQPVSYLMSLKSTFRKIFKALCTEAQREKVLAATHTHFPITMLQYMV